MNPGQTGQDDLMLQYLLEMGALSPEQEQLARQQQMVTGLRANALNNPPQMRQAGRVSVASHPLEALGNIAQQGVASWKERGVDQGMRDLATKRQGILGRLGGGKPAGLQQLGGPGIDLPEV